jgi:hypothetical protein
MWIGRPIIPIIRHKGTRAIRGMKTDAKARGMKAQRGRREDKREKGSKMRRAGRSALACREQGSQEFWRVL